MSLNNTHIKFNENKIEITPDIVLIFTFLMEIEKEISDFIGFNEKIGSLKENYLELLNFTTFLSNKLVENNIDFKYSLKEDLQEVAQKFNYSTPIRSQVIVLFTSLDVLFNLHMAYEIETVDEDELRKLTMDTKQTKKFINDFLLTENNQFYKDNKIRLSKIDSGKIKELRNSLVHFFSIGQSGLSLISSKFDAEGRKFERIFKQNKKGNIIFISPEDLYGLIKSATLLRVAKWSEDCYNDNTAFKNKIRFTNELITKKGAVIIPSKQLTMNP
jgi:hypothetical protein